MKKRIVTMLATGAIMVFALAGCGNSNDDANTDADADTAGSESTANVDDANSTDVGETNPDIDRTELDGAVKAFADAGVKIDSENRPASKSIYAETGVMFNMADGAQVQIFQFANEEDLAAGIEVMPELKDAPKKGLLVLVTTSEEAKEIFASAK